MWVQFFDDVFFIFQPVFGVKIELYVEKITTVCGEKFRAELEHQKQGSAQVDSDQF